MLSASLISPSDSPVSSLVNVLLQIEERIAYTERKEDWWIALLNSIVEVPVYSKGVLVHTGDIVEARRG